MPDHSHFAILEQGVEEWNIWRKQHPDVLPDLRQAYLLGRNLKGANFSSTDLAGARMTECFLYQARLDGANLHGVRMENVDLCEASLIGANLRGANLEEAKLLRSDLSDADLSGACLINAHLVGTNLERATLTGCFVHGISAWNLKLDGAHQEDLVITRYPDPTVTVDNIEVAQFIYLLRNSQKVRNVIETIRSKVVLILGRFTPERKTVLDAMRNELRHRNYSPVVFDFENPPSGTTIETVSTLAHMARFVIADLTDAKSVLQELQAIVPSNPSVPVQPVILNTEAEPGMFDYFKAFRSVLKPYQYDDQDGLLSALTDKVIGPAEAKVKNLTRRRNSGRW